MEHKKRNHEVVGAVPYGYQRHGKDLLPHLAEQVIIKDINEMYAAGRNLTEITRALNESGRLTRAGRHPLGAHSRRRLISDYTAKFKRSKTKISMAARQFIEAIG